MLVYPLLVLDLHRTFIIKGYDNIGKNPLSCPFRFPMTPFSNIASINEKATGCINEEAIGPINAAIIGAIIAVKNLPACSFISCFIVSPALSINRSDFSCESTILTISFRSSN